MSFAMKIFYSALIIITMSGMPSFAVDDSVLEDVRAKMSSMFQEIEPEHINSSPVDGWYTVQKGLMVAYVSKDGRYLLQGDLIDLDSQVNLSEITRTDSRRTLILSFEDDQFISFTPEVVKHRVTIFTDIDCTYCRKLHSQINDYLAAGIEIRYILYPRNGPASPSWNTSEDVWCSGDRNAALTAAKLDRSFDSKNCDMSAISEQYMLGQSVGLTGTPAIVFEDGTIVNGYLPPEALVSRLQILETAIAN
ncbi:MAG: DsbC family protein [Woeseiaceae bacterium]|nr:DsbC family protein [Woeseiaceae bacterium]